MSETRKQLARFIVVGFTCVAVDLSVYRWLGWSMDLRLDIAKGLSFWAGVMVGFVGNKLWTFRSPRRSLAEPFAYFALYGTTMFVNVGCNSLLLAALGPKATAVAYVVATAVTTVMNFLGMRLVAFRRGIDQRLGMTANADASSAVIPIPKQQAIFDAAGRTTTHEKAA